MLKELISLLRELNEPLFEAGVGPIVSSFIIGVRDL